MLMCERGARQCRAGAMGAPLAPWSKSDDGISGDDGVETSQRRCWQCRRGIAGGRAGGKKNALISAPLLWQQSAPGCRGAEMDLRGGLMTPSPSLLQGAPTDLF